MRIFITGISGYLGSLLAFRLSELPEVDCITGIDITSPIDKLPEKVNFIRMDVVDAFICALRRPLSGAYNVVPDDAIPLSEVAKIIGFQKVPSMPGWMARFVTMLRWRVLGSTIYPSWFDETYLGPRYLFSLVMKS